MIAIKKIIQKQNYLEIYLILLIIILNSLIVIPILSATTFSLDEAYSWMFSTDQYNFNIFSDVHPPLYYFLLKIWLIIVPTSEFNIRFLSFIFGTISLIFLFLITDILFKSKSLAFLSVIFVLIMPYYIFNEQFARMYTLLSMTSFGFIYYYLRYLETNNINDKVLTILFGSLSLYSHYYAFFSLLGMIIFLIAYYYKNIKIIKDSLLIYLIMFFLYLPQTLRMFNIIFFRKSSISDFGNSFWNWIDDIPNNTINQVFQNITYKNEEIILFIVILFSIGLLKLKINEKYKSGHFLILILLIATSIVPYIISEIFSYFFGFKIFLDRYLIISSMLIGLIFVLSIYNITFLIYYLLSKRIIILNIPNKSRNFILLTGLSLIAILLISVNFHSITNLKPNSAYDEFYSKIKGDYNPDSVIIYVSGNNFPLMNFYFREGYTQSIVKLDPNNTLNMINFNNSLESQMIVWFLYHSSKVELFNEVKNLFNFSEIFNGTNGRITAYKLIMI